MDQTLAQILQELYGMGAENAQLKAINKALQEELKKSTTPEKSTEGTSESE